MAGFRSEVVYANNGDFSIANSQGGFASNGLQTNGQMWIGTTTPNVGGTHISVGTITSPLGTISVGYTFPNITIDSVGGLPPIEELFGDTGFASGTNVNIVSGLSTLNSGSSVEFVGNESTTLTLNVTDANQNTLIGNLAGNATLSGAQSTGLGQSALASSTADSNNTAIGFNSLTSLDGGNGNTAVGSQAMQGLQTGSANCAVGYETLFSATSAANNNMVGEFALYNLVDGTYNATLGDQGGYQYTSDESNNVLLNSVGVTGDNNTLRIGSGTGSAQQELNQAFICGINGTTIFGSLMVTIDPGTDQLGVAPVPPYQFPWSDATTGAHTALANNGYFVVGTTTSTLPASPIEGNTVRYIVDTASILTIQATGTQVIRLGADVSGAAGTAVNTVIGDAIELIYRTSGTKWIAGNGFVGSWNVT